MAQELESGSTFFRGSGERTTATFYPRVGRLENTLVLADFDLAAAFSDLQAQRRPRLMLANVPLHIISRGNNRQACFFADDDYQFYLDWLQQYAIATGCRIHAYVLMTNHVHLLLSSLERDGVDALMKALGQRYVQYVNRTYRRSGTLWEGRYHSSLTQEENYFLACQRYIELNPIRAAMVAHPAEYRWPSGS